MYGLLDGLVSRMMLELDTAGNIRLEEGRATDLWFASCSGGCGAARCSSKERTYWYPQARVGYHIYVGYPSTCWLPQHVLGRNPKHGQAPARWVTGSKGTGGRGLVQGCSNGCQQRGGAVALGAATTDKPLSRAVQPDTT